jgi:hypothetical protein
MGLGPWIGSSAKEAVRVGRAWNCQPTATAYAWAVTEATAGIAEWTPEQIALAKRWVRTWKEAAPVLERLRREELRRLDPELALRLLCGPANYRVPPRVARPSSGLVEQQRWFLKAAGRA